MAVGPLPDLKESNVSHLRFASLLLSVLVLLVLAGVSSAEVCNVKVVTDANPDYYDMPSMIRSISAKWEEPRDKVWAMFYWNHVARRQTAPMQLHGFELTDPIRQFNDYGYTQCSTISGINCAIWDAMGLKAKFWDISLHTVAEVYYDDAWHLIDNSLSTTYTKCDGKTLASVMEIGAEGACELSGGKKEEGHVAKYHCLHATSINGFLEGADTARSVDSEHQSFSRSHLYRWYYYNWDAGHRYILNLGDSQTYTRYYRPLELSDTTANPEKYTSDPHNFVPNPESKGADPEACNRRYRIRGNGVWTFEPSLKAGEYAKSIYSQKNIAASAAEGLKADKPGTPGEVIFKVQAANVITSEMIDATFNLGGDSNASISISTTNGLKWTEVWKSDKTGDVAANADLIKDVNGSYEVLVKVSLRNAARLKSISIKTVTMINSKTQPRLNVGKNTVYVGAGEQTESIVFWPDLREQNYKDLVVDEQNIKTDTVAGYETWHGAMYQAEGKKEGYITFKIETPTDMTRLTYGGRLYNRGYDSHIDLLHSFDGGKTWITSYSLTNKEAPWDTIHYSTVDKIPVGTRSVLVKYSLNGSQPGNQSCNLYAVRMEANYKPADASFKPMEIVYTWKEVQDDYKLVTRSHTQSVDKVPFTYEINVGGVDHPVMESLKMCLRTADSTAKTGYSDGNDIAAKKYVPQWVTYGKNLMQGKPYTVSIPSGKSWGAGDPEGKRLTDGIVGPNDAGTPAPAYGLYWEDGQKPVVDVDLGKEEQIGVFRIHISAGWPWWDAAKGEVKDEVEVLTSTDNKEFVSQGKFDFRIFKKNLPVNFMLADDESAAGFMFNLILPKTVKARYVRYNITPKRTLVVTEIQALDEIKYTPFDLKLALPGEKVPDPKPMKGITPPPPAPK